MQPHRLRHLPAALGLLLTATAAGAQASEEPIHRRSAQADFDAVSFGVESAIENRGYVIDYHARVGEMLERTADDVGADDSPYLHAETWQFCPALLSRRAMDADPANVAFCPYVVFAYETRDAPGTVVVGFRTHSIDTDAASTEALGAIDRELEAIVAEATE